MMIFGTTAAVGFDDFPQPDFVQLYATAGCQVAQVYRNINRNPSPRDVLSQLSAGGLRVDSLHGVFGDDIDPSDEDEAARRAAVEIYRREADFCKQLGGTLVVVHPCPANKPDEHLDAKYAQLRRSFDELARIGEQTGVLFAFENMPPYHPVGSDVERLVREVALAGSPHIVFLLDTGHAHMTCGAPLAIRLGGRSIRYTHIHDNDGKNDTHLLPGRGTISWDRCRDEFHAVGYDGVFLLEVFDPADVLKSEMNDAWQARMRSILNHH